MGTFDPFTGLTELIHDVELAIDQVKIDQVKKTLVSNVDNVDHDRFKHLHVPSSAFGGNGSAATLGLHHLEAHAVIRSTLEGLLADLKAFREGLDYAESLIHGADEASAADLQRKRAAVEGLVRLAKHDTGGERNHQARNQFLRATEGGGASA